MLKYLANPLISIVTIVIILIVILSIFRAANLTMGFGMRAHLGNLRTSFMIEGFEDGAAPAFVMYYADWCGHCKRTKPFLEEAMTEYKGKIQIVMIDAEDAKHAALVKQEGISGFPTIRYYKGGMPKVGKKAEYEEYDGDRSKAGFLQYLRSKE